MNAEVDLSRHHSGVEEVNTRPLILYILDSRTAFNIYTKQITYAIQPVFCKAAKECFLGNGNEQSFEKHPCVYALLLQLY